MSDTGNSDAGGGTVTGEGLWKQFRAAYPYHIQTVAFDKTSGTLIISEPPPHVTLASLKRAIQRYNPALDPAMRIMTNPVGADGWAKDILLQLPPLDEAHTREALDAIQQHVFHTTYKAYVTPLPVGEKPSLRNDKLNLNVSIAEVRKWLFGDSEPLSGIMGGRETTAAQLLASKTPGVFFSKSRGLVVWSLNRTQLISDYLVESRQFALDSDLIVGAVNEGNQILIVGRERVVPVDVLPPLRAETVMLLASVGDQELQQSYERTHIFAGRFDETWDWAPIFLSDALIDTEYGSLLNITDQLLKRWSMNGFIEYKNFNYPDPPRWCFDKSLYEEVGATSLTFNWNTRGVGYTAEIGGRDFFAINRSGSLPTSYLEGEDKSGYTEQEEKGYNWFSGLGDPNLARVVQYASLYQIFQRYPVHRDPSFVKKPKPPQTDVLTDNAESALRVFILLAVAGSDRADVPPDLRQKLADYRDSIVPVIQQYGEPGLHGLARAIAYPRLTTEEQAQLSDLIKQLTQARRNPALYQQRLAAIPKAQQIKLLAFLLSTSLLRDQSAKALILLAGDIDIKKIKDDYVSASRRDDNEWIRTASVVISRPLGRFKDLNGGHNLDSAVTRFRIAEEVPPGTIRTVRTGNRLTFWINPADAAKVPSLVRKAAGLSEGRLLTPEAEGSIREALQAELRGGPPPQPPRTINTALLTPDGPGGGDRGFSGAGANGYHPEPKLIPLVVRQTEEAQRLSRYGDVAVTVQRSAGAEGSEYVITAADGRVIRAYSTPSAIDAVADLGRSAARQNPKVAFHLDGFTEGEAEGFLYNTELQMRNGSLIGFARNGEAGAVARAADYRLPGVNVGEHSIARIADGPRRGFYELKIDLDVPSQSAVRQPLHLRLQMLYRNVISDPTVVGVKGAIRTFFSRPVAADADMSTVIMDLGNELRVRIPGAKNVMTVSQQDTSGLIITELELPQSDVGNLRENGKSE